MIRTENPLCCKGSRSAAWNPDGMICSEYELDLGDDKDGIKILEPSAAIGTPLAKYLRRNDIVYDIEVTANRGDWLSHRESHAKSVH